MNNGLKNFNIKIGVLVEKEGMLLLIKEKNSKDKKFYWNIIKGTFDPKIDKNIFDCAIRESWEEAKINIRLNKLINIIYLNKGKGSLFQFNFLANTDDANPRLLKHGGNKIKGEKIIDLKFFSKKELQKFKINELMNKRTYLTIQDWLKNKNIDLSYIKILTDN